LYDTDTSLHQLTRTIGAASAARVYRLGLDAVDRIDAMCAQLGDRCGFTRRPSLYLASSRSSLRALRQEFNLRRDLGLPVEWLSRPDFEPAYSFNAVGAIRAQGTAEVNTYRLTCRLLEAAASAGARIFDRTAVTRLQRDRDGARLEIASGHTVRASRVVMASGYEAALMLRRRTGRLTSTWLFASEPLESFEGWSDRCLIWETARPYLYVRSTDDGRLLAGGEDEPGAFTHRSRRRFDRKIARLVTRAGRMFPRIRLEVAFSWAATFAATDDGLPFIGAVPEHPGVWFALAYGGNGITFSMIAATLLRDACLGRPNDDARIFRFDR
jgi:glycine/D-amino acid oxidase-like deaminating enzyme